MFGHIDFAGLFQSKLFGYAKDVPFFKDRERLSFKPGLNILVGPNGSGKSTVINLLAKSLCAYQGGVSTVTEGVIHDTVDMMAHPMADSIGVAIAHDGQAVVHCDPRNEVGLDSGHFDDDFFAKGLEEIKNRGSHGQKALRRATEVLALLDNPADFPQGIVQRITSRRYNDTWLSAAQIVEKRLAATLPLGQPSILLDEPEANFSLEWQVRLWKRLADPAVAERYQVIVASHSPFALGIAHANYLEVSPGYAATAEALLRERFAPPAVKRSRRRGASAA